MIDFGIDSGFEYQAIGPQDEQPRKLVVLLHGYGRNSTYMAKMAEEMRGAVPDALVLSLNGPQAMNNQAIAAAGDHALHIPEEIQAGDDGLHPDMQRQWFAIEGGIAHLIPRLKDIAARINHFIDQQRDMMGIADADIAIMGFSQGAATAMYVAYTRAQLIAGVVCHSAVILDKPEYESHFRSAPRTLYLYGTNDPEFPQSRYQDSSEWVRGYTGGNMVHEKITGLGHYTSAQSRKICAAFIRDVFAD